MADKDLFSGIKITTKEEWLELVQKDLKGASFDDKLVHEIDGIQLQPLYTKEDLPHFIELNDEDDFEFETDEALNTEEQIQYWNVCEELNANGTENLEDIVIDALNRGANHIRISAQDQKTWDKIASGINRIQFPIIFSLNIEDDLLSENIVSTWRNRVGAMGDRDRLVHALEFDPINYWRENGKPETTGKTFTSLAEIFLRISGHLQDCKLMKADATRFLHADAGYSMQLAQTLAIASDYIDQLSKRNIAVEELLQAIQFRFNIGENFYFELAKLRAFKIIWTNFVKAFAPDMDMIPHPDIHCSVQFNNTEDKYSNLLRGTSSAMSAILGGCDALSLAAYDPEDEKATRLAINTHNILRYESYFDRYRDAANGSYFIEHLTAEIAENAWNKFLETEQAGGFLKQHFS